MLDDNGSVPGGLGTPEKARNPSADGNCEPSASDDLSDEQMLLDFSASPPFVAVWVNAGGGNWTMDYVATGVLYAPLSKLGTVSIRNAPGAAAVKASGKITNKPQILFPRQSIAPSNAWGRRELRRPFYYNVYPCARLLVRNIRG